MGKFLESNNPITRMIFDIKKYFFQSHFLAKNVKKNTLLPQNFDVNDPETHQD